MRHALDAVARHRDHRRRDQAPGGAADGRATSASCRRCCAERYGKTPERSSRRDRVHAADPTEDDVCRECAGHPLNAARCRQIHEAVVAAGGNVSVAARTLGISRTTITQARLDGTADRPARPGKRPPGRGSREGRPPIAPLTTTSPRASTWRRRPRPSDPRRLSRSAAREQRRRRGGRPSWHGLPPADPALAASAAPLTCGTPDAECSVWPARTWCPSYGGLRNRSVRSREGSCR